MTGAELQKARLRLGVSGAEFARAFDVAERTLRGWEAGSRAGLPVEVPRLVALVARLALKDAKVRAELGLAKRKVKREGADGNRDARGL